MFFGWSSSGETEGLSRVPSSFEERPENEHISVLLVEDSMTRIVPA